MDDLVERSDKLDEEIAGSSTIAHLTAASRRNRRLIQFLAVSLAFDVLLSFVVAGLAWRAEAVAEQANSIQARQKATCLSGNETRAGQLQLWAYVLDITPPSTPEEKLRADQFRAYVGKLFAPRKC